MFSMSFQLQSSKKCRIITSHEMKMGTSHHDFERIKDDPGFRVCYTSLKKTHRIFKRERDRDFKMYTRTENCLHKKKIQFIFSFIFSFIFIIGWKPIFVHSIFISFTQNLRKLQANYLSNDKILSYYLIKGTYKYIYSLINIEFSVWPPRNSKKPQFHYFFLHN